MITNFEELTKELNEYEKQKLLPVILKGLKTKIGKSNAVTNLHIVTELKKAGYKITDVRIRKIIHFIRVNSLISNLISTSKGYYITTDVEEFESYLKSLKQRMNSIYEIHQAMEEQFYILKFGK